MIENPFRSELQRIPFLNDTLDMLMSFLFGFLKAEHKDDGTHSDVTADSVTTDTLTVTTLDGDDATFDSLTVNGPTAISVSSGSDVPLAAVSTSSSSSTVGAILGGHAANIRLLVEVGGANVLASIIGWSATSIAWSNASTTSTSFAWVDGQGNTLMSVSSLTGTPGNLTVTAGVIERGRSAAIGEWTAVAHAAGNFTASAGTWTVDLADQVVYSYMLVGKTLWVNFTINNTDVSNAGVTLNIKIPGGFTCATQAVQPILSTNAGAAPALAFALITAGGTTINCFATAAGGGFGITAADNTNVSGCVCIEIQ